MVAAKFGYRKAPPEQQVQILNKRASQLAEKLSFAALDKLCKERPDLLYVIVRHLEGVGVKLNLVNSLGKKRANGELENGSTEDSFKVRNLIEAQGVQDPDLNNWLGPKHTRLDHTTASTLEKVVSALEEIAFNVNMLQALKDVKTSAAHYKSMLLEILEYDTGFDVSIRLPENLRHIPTLISHLQAMRDQRKCRGHNLRLPPHWHSSGDGVFSIKEGPLGQILVVNKFTTDCRLLSESSMTSFFGSDTGLLDLHIVNNFSEIRASIGSHHADMLISIGSLPRVDDPSSPGKQ